VCCIETRGPMVTTLHVVALSCYLAVAVTLSLSLARGGRRVPRWVGQLAVAAVGAHAAGLGAYVVVYDELPLVGMAPSLSVLGFLIGASLLVLAWPGEARTLGVVISPLVSLILGMALRLGIEPTGALAAYRGLWLYFHTILSFVGYAGLALAFAAGVVYLLQFRELKGKRLGRIFRFFPALEVLDRVGLWALLLGFPALTVGLLVGWAWTARFEVAWAVREPKVVWGILSWVTYAVAVAVRGVGNGSRRRGAVFAVAGFVLVVVTYLVLRATEAVGGVFL